MGGKIARSGRISESGQWKTYSGSGLFDVAYGEVNWRTIVDTAANRQSQKPTTLPPYNATYSTHPKSQTGKVYPLSLMPTDSCGFVAQP